MLLGGLCISDILVGLVVQPIFLLDINQKHRCAITNRISLALKVTIALCCGWSFLFILLITLDRFAAIHYPFRYGAVATAKTNMIIGASAAVFWAMFSVVTNAINYKYFLYGYMVTGTSAALSIVICYACISRVILKHRRKVTTLGTISGESASGENTTQVQNQKKEQDQTRAVAAILALFLVCFMPPFGLTLYNLIYQPNLDEKARNRLTVVPWIDLFILINSCLNPVVYYIRCEAIRKAVLKAVFCKW